MLRFQRNYIPFKVPWPQKGCSGLQKMAVFMYVVVVVYRTDIVQILT